MPLFLAMGLCGNTTQNLCAGTIPLVLPLVHDCHGLLLGNNARYLAEENRAVFFHQGAVERLGAEGVDAVPKRFGLGRTLEEYIQEYGEDNGRYIHEMECGFVNQNRRALYLFRERTSDMSHKCRRNVELHAKRMGWEIDAAEIDMTPFHRLLSGVWEGDFCIVVQPGESVNLRVGPSGNICRRHDGEGSIND